MWLSSHRLQVTILDLIVTLHGVQQRVCFDVRICTKSHTTTLQNCQRTFSHMQATHCWRGETVAVPKNASILRNATRNDNCAVQRLMKDYMT